MGVDAQKWTAMLYNHAVRLVIDYFVINLKGGEARTDRDASSFSIHNMKSESDENEEAIKNGGEYEHIGYEWMFEVLKSRYHEPDGRHVVRIIKQLSEMETLLIRELGVGVRNPEGACGWVGKKRMELKSLRMFLTNRAMFNYF